MVVRPVAGEPVARQSVHDIDREHAKLSASGSHRWLHCTASAWMELHFDEESSEFADEGTRAHGMASDCLHHDLTVTEWREREQYKAQDRLWHEACREASEAWENAQISLEEWNAKIAELGELRDENNVPGYFEWEAQFDLDHPAEMFDVVAEYIAFVHIKIAEAKHRNPDCIIYIERRVDFSKWVPEGFGTADCIIISDGVLTVIDLKYGKGVFVSVEENPQAMLYGLGSYSMFKHLFVMDQIHMVIFQPRIGNIAQFDLSIKQLLDWAEGYVKPIAKVVWHSMHNDDLTHVEFEPEVERCRFCAGRNRCRARTDEMLEMAKYANDEAIMSIAEVAALLPRTKHLKLWATNLEAHALKEAEKGVVVPDHKLVEGRSNRRVTHEGRVTAILRAEGFKKEQLYKSKFIGITDLISLVKGEKRLYSFVGSYIDKPKGKPVLVSNDDPREAIDKVDAEAQGF
jgi:hypothetical protein